MAVVGGRGSGQEGSHVHGCIEAGRARQIPWIPCPSKAPREEAQGDDSRQNRSKIHKQKKKKSAKIIRVLKEEGKEKDAVSGEKRAVRLI